MNYGLWDNGTNRWVKCTDGREYESDNKNEESFQASIRIMGILHRNGKVINRYEVREKP